MTVAFFRRGTSIKPAEKSKFVLVFALVFLSSTWLNGALFLFVQAIGVRRFDEKNQQKCVAFAEFTGLKNETSGAQRTSTSGKTNVNVERGDRGHRLVMSLPRSDFVHVVNGTIERLNRNDRAEMIGRPNVEKNVLKARRKCELVVHRHRWRNVELTRDPRLEQKIGQILQLNRVGDERLIRSGDLDEHPTEMNLRSIHFVL